MSILAMDFADHSKRVPPVTAVLGQACYQCFKGERADAPLRRCTKCRTVQYCSTGCQQANWKEHKGICKALHSLENDESFHLVLLKFLNDEPSEDPSTLNSIINSMVMTQCGYIEDVLNRKLTTPERNLMGWEPRCMGCGRSDRILRIEATEEGKKTTSNTLKSCHACKMAFYCSAHHWNVAEHRHASEPCEDGEGLTQCHMNQDIRRDVAFSMIMEGANAGEFEWAPERVAEWKSIKDTDWEAEYASQIVADFQISNHAVRPFLRAASDGLSMPMTILSALEHLNNDLDWTRADTLTIHLIGAYQIEITKARIFEEIMHRLPQVKTLKLVLCGPELAQVASSGARNRDVSMETCSDCRTRGRKRIHHLIAQTYHEYAKASGRNFTKPHLAIAFNSGSSQESVQSWKPTLSFLVENNIPSVFTAYNREEAEEEAQLLSAAGADLVPALGPVKNPWGSLLTKAEPNRVDGFYAVNGWLSGGFR